MSNLLDLMEISNKNSLADNKDNELKQLEHEVASFDTQSSTYDDSEALQNHQKLLKEGRTELLGNLLLNKPVKVIGTCKDSFDELLYLVTFEPTETEAFLPQWCHSWILREVAPSIIDDFVLTQLYYPCSL